MIEKGSIVQGNWSTIQYRVDHVWMVKGEKYWCINGKAVDNPLQSGSFSYLGFIVGDEILITDERRPDDRVIIIKEKNPPKRKNEQMILPLK